MSDSWIDISVPLHNGMVHWPDNPPITIKRYQAIEHGDPCNVTWFSLGAHTGTHMDAPWHFLPAGERLDALPFEAVVGPARVVAIQDQESIKPKELRALGIQPGERILFKTRNSWRCWQSDTFVTDFVYLSQSGARYLADQGVRTVGIDYLSVGGFTRDGFETHTALLEAGVWIIEGINLSEVQPGMYDLICLPLKLAADGSPARAIVRRRSERK